MSQNGTVGVNFYFDGEEPLNKMIFFVVDENIKQFQKENPDVVERGVLD